MIGGARLVSDRENPWSSPGLVVAHLLVSHKNYFAFFLADVEEKVKEERKKQNLIDKREWYEEDDDSHLKNQVKPNLLQPDFKKKLEEAARK